MANILITGASGYLGGSLLAHLKKDGNLIQDTSKVYALVRTDEQAAKVKQHFNAEPTTLDLQDEADITKTLSEKRISIVLFLIDAVRSEAQVKFIRALAKVQQETGVQAHFVHTTGAKGFSSHTGFPTEPPLTDEDAGLYDIQKNVQHGLPIMRKIALTNNAVIEAAETYGVRSYIIAPCIIYGEGTGFGNPVSIQTVAIVKAAKATRRVYSLDTKKPVWPVCHISDISSLYAHLLRKMVHGEEIGFNRQGYYLASSGLVAWDDIYAAIAKALAVHDLVDDDRVHLADDAAIERMAKGLGIDAPMVAVSLGGLCTWTPTHGNGTGWTAQHRPEHILDTAQEEVDLILRNL